MSGGKVPSCDSVRFDAAWQDVVDACKALPRDDFDKLWSAAATMGDEFYTILAYLDAVGAMAAVDAPQQIADLTAKLRTACVALVGYHVRGCSAVGPCVGCALQEGCPGRQAGKALAEIRETSDIDV